MADRVGLHQSTVRFHLDGLVAAGHARRGTAPRDTAGRPPATYEATQTPPQDDWRGYRLLATILASTWARTVPDAEDVAARSGEEWGQYLTERLAPYESLDREQAIARLVALLDDLGFAPEPVSDARGDRIQLRECPFRDTVVEDSRIPCAVHLGLMRGSLAELGADITVAELDPLVEPRLCVAHLARPQPDAGQTG